MKDCKKKTEINPNLLGFISVTSMIVSFISMCASWYFYYAS